MKAPDLDSLITAMRLILSYNPETGEWIRLTSKGMAKAGERAGRVAGGGYLQIGVAGRRYMAQRLAFLWMTGNWPEGDVDHANGIKLDNRWSNLRQCTRSLNVANSPRRSDNLSGYKGVRLHQGSRKWQARINQISLGIFDTPEEAYAAYCAAAHAAFGEFARAA
jgi:hypothetical protein